MTNKEHLATLTSQEWMDRMHWLQEIYKQGYSNYDEAIKVWLDSPYSARKPIAEHEVGTLFTAYFCPVCYSAVCKELGHDKCYTCITDLDWTDVKS